MILVIWLIGYLVNRLFDDIGYLIVRCPVSPVIPIAEERTKLYRSDGYLVIW